MFDLMTKDAKKFYAGCPDPREYVPSAWVRACWRLCPCIEVSFTNSIPSDWPGAMDVPISYMDKHDPDRFEILDSIKPTINGRKLYQRIIIRNKRPEMPEWVRAADYGLCLALVRAKAAPSTFHAGLRRPIA